MPTPVLSSPSARDARGCCSSMWLTTVVLLGMVCGWVPAHAERADRQKPLHAESDVLRYDDARQLSIFTGNVVITKGSIVIRGDKVEVRQDAQGHQFGTVTGSPQKKAFFRQKREGVDEFIEGEAERIDYNGQADTVQFTNQAVMRRYRGAMLTDETAGSTIVYDNTKDTFVVEAGATQRTTSNPSGRVRAVLTPTPKPDSSTSLPTPTTSPALKPTTGLNGSKP